MDIFKSDGVLDQLNEDDLGDSLLEGIVRGIGFQYSLDRNKLEKKYDSEPVRARSMHPIHSNVKTMSPFDLVFNSLLIKSKLAYDMQTTEPY